MSFRKQCPAKPCASQTYPLETHAPVFPERCSFFREHGWIHEFVTDCRSSLACVAKATHARIKRPPPCRVLTIEHISATHVVAHGWSRISNALPRLAVSTAESRQIEGYREIPDITPEELFTALAQGPLDMRALAAQVLIARGKIPKGAAIFVRRGLKSTHAALPTLHILLASTRMPENDSHRSTK